MPTRVPIGIVLALAVTGCMSDHATGGTVGSSHTAAAPPGVTQRELRGLRQQLFAGVDQAWADEATAVLAIAHACAPAGVSGGAGAYRRCQARHHAGSESIGDNGVFPGTEAFTAFVATSAIEDSVVSTLANDATTPAPCRRALARYGQAWNYADSAIEPMHAAERAHNFSAVRRIATTRTIERMETLLAQARPAVANAC
jgi:hypothetical protein